MIVLLPGHSLQPPQMQPAPQRILPRPIEAGRNLVPYQNPLPVTGGVPFRLIVLDVHPDHIVSAFTGRLYIKGNASRSLSCQRRIRIDPPGIIPLVQNAAEIDRTSVHCHIRSPVLDRLLPHTAKGNPAFIRSLKAALPTNRRGEYIPVRCSGFPLHKPFSKDLKCSLRYAAAINR